jgi:redox-sensitive bicupin YhaK (pirin superfamily)
MPIQTEGRMRGFQLWVNLPARLKMGAPDYQEFDAGQMPVEDRPGGVQVKVVAGATAAGTASPVGGSAVEARYFDVAAPTGGRFEEPLPEGLNGMLVVYDGAVRVAGTRVEAIGCAFLGPGDTVSVEAESDARFLLIAGRPINEPVAWAGPFVMNSREEVMQAYEDFRSGRF